MSWSTASRPDGLEQPVVGTSGATDSPEPAFPAVPHPEPARPTDDPAVMREAWRTLSVVGLASVFSGMSNSALNVALPAIAREYDASATASSWILLSFMLTQTLLMVSFGRLADLFGRRSMYLTGLAVFTVGNLLAGFAPDAWWLVACRVLQAAGAAISAEYPGVEVEAVVGDFTRHLGELPRSGRRLVAFLGSTIGNLEPEARAAFLAELAGTLQPGDSFLLGTDLVKDPARLVRAYDDAAGVTAEFNRNVLRVLDRELGADFDPAAFEHVAVWDAEHEWIEMRLRSLTDQVVHVPALDLDVRFAAGEEMRTEVSAKFRRERVEAELAAAGLRMTSWWTDPDGDFGVSLSVPA